jgi:UDP-N-acetylmuramoyl-tripeptide--D-alanyl-D-alanine ligase
MIDPDIAIVLAVGRVHSNNFPDLEAIAVEKSSLLGRIRGSRIAILNADDPHVRAMATTCRGKVMTFGRSEDNDLWATEVSARWPSRLSFRAHTRTESCWVRTNLIGEHWLNSALAVLLASLACGVKLEKAAAALEAVQPVTGRMQPALLPNGATVIRDDFSESASTMDAALNVLRDADVPRRVAVLGDVYDSPLKERPRLEDLGSRAASAADVAVFIGKKMRYAVGRAVAAGMSAQSARAFDELPEAAEFLASEFRNGDLVLIRGYSQRHLERLYFAQLGNIRCWKKRCSKTMTCDRCDELGLHRPQLGQTSLAGGPGRNSR